MGVMTTSRLALPLSVVSGADSRTYDGEERWVLDLRARHPRSPLLAALRSPSEASHLAAVVAARSGYGPTRIRVAFDIAEHDWRGGCVTDGDLVHLRPEVETWMLLHELAHVLAPGLGHGARWATTYLGLVETLGGPAAAAALRAELAPPRGRRP